MRRFDYFPDEEGKGYLLNVQSQMLVELNMAAVVPLVPAKTVRTPIRNLNPVFQIDGKDYLMRTQFLGAVPKSMLKASAGSLSSKHSDIMNALDMLFTGV